MSLANIPDLEEDVMGEEMGESEIEDLIPYHQNQYRYGVLLGGTGGPDSPLFGVGGRTRTL